MRVAGMHQSASETGLPQWVNIQAWNVAVPIPATAQKASVYRLGQSSVLKLRGRIAKPLGEY